MAKVMTSGSDMQLAKKIKESANQIWLAGLGAYVKAEKEGSKLFDTLVRDGKKMENKTKEDKKTTYRERVEEVKDKAAHSWEKIEKAFDERVAKTLAKLNIPTKQDVDALALQLKHLQAAVEKAGLIEKPIAKKTIRKKTAP